jgi:hypothetical protein
MEGPVRTSVAVPEVVTTGEGTCNIKLPGDPSGPPDGARRLGGPDAPRVLERDVCGGIGAQMCFSIHKDSFEQFHVGT